MTMKKPGWITITLCNECKGNDVGIVDIEMPYAPGRTLRGEWVGLRGERLARLERVEETPRREAPIDNAERMCEAQSCSLEPTTGPFETTIRTRPVGGNGEGHSDLGATEEGTLAMHLWMRYEYAK